MSSERVFVSKKGNFAFERHSRSSKPNHPYLWRQGTPKRSSSRSRTPATKQIRKMKKPIKIRTSRNSRSRREYELLKTSQVCGKQPDSPHNTTQYIIDANSSTETVNLYKPIDRFEFDFQHHAMAGSMMDLMKNRFAQMQEQLASPTTATTCESSTGSLEEPNEEFHDGFCNDHQTPQTDSLTRESLCNEEKLQDKGVDRDLDNDYCFNIAGKDENEKNFYNQYLEEAETGEDLKGLVRHLVSVLEQKDQEIDDLKQRLQFQIVSNVAKRDTKRHDSGLHPMNMFVLKAETDDN